MSADPIDAVTVLRAWAANSAAFAHAIRRREPDWGSEVFPFGDGTAVLCGAGLYVNAAMAAGLDRDVRDDEFDDFESRCHAAGLDPAVEVSPATRPTMIDVLARRGYRSGSQRAALRRTLDDVDTLPTPDPAFRIETAVDQLGAWSDTAAAGWGHHTVAARRASDAFAGAATEVDGDGMVLVRDAADGRPIGCASTTCNGLVATLGGMSTVPWARRRGVQGALIGHRLRLAAAAGCTLATSTTEPGSDSERNLLRHGFVRWGTVDTWTLGRTSHDR